MKGIIRYAKRYWLWIFVILLSGLGCSAANVFIVDILKQIIDRSLSGAMSAFLPEALLKSAAAILIGMSANYFVVRTTGFLGAKVLRDMRHDIVNHIMRMAPDFMEKHNFGDIMERLSSDVDTIAGYIQNYFKDCLYVPIAVTVFAAYLVSQNLFLSVVCLGPLLIVVPLSIKLLKPVKLAQAEYVKRLGMTNNHIQEAFDGVEVIKAYNMQKKLRNKYYRALSETLKISDQNDLWQYNIEPLSALIREAPAAIALCAGGYLVLKGQISLGILVAFITGIKKINEPLVYAYQLVVRTQMAVISASRVFEILETPVENEKGTPLELKKISDHVFEFKDASFHYAASRDESDSVLKQFNLSIGEGKRVALVGQSGSGKSTVLKLMCRQYGLDGGEISFYGNPFSRIDPELVRNQIAFISQETMIFPMSIRDNIRIGRAEAGLDEIVDAAKKAECHAFIMELPQGYDTLLEERGNNLSGGQRQRIAIARAILKDSPVLLLDEPTSALDRETEEHVNKTLSAVSLDKTIITAAHRLNTVIDYDEILVLEKGRIVESGTHEELLRKKGKYYKMYQDYTRSGGAAG